MSNFCENDHRFMSQAIELAKLGIYSTSPNPNVGCVLVKNNEVIATGFHLQAGKGHAEVNALAKVTAQQGEHCTAYVTLEPCSHVGKTGSCAHALIAAKVTRVVCAMQDPNPLVAGNGFALLRAAGIEVAVGLMREQAEALNPGFIKRMSQQLPWVNIKLAMSLDGRTAMQSGESQWITGSAARADVQRLRAQSCAIITGIGSIVHDDSSLMVREGELELDTTDFDLELIKQKQPLRVVLDSKNQLAKNAKIINQPGRTLRVIACAKTEENDDVICMANESGQIDLLSLLQYLAKVEQCNNVLVEAGATLAGSFVENELFDQLTVYMAPTILGATARPLLAINKDYMAQQQRLKMLSQSMVGDDIRLIYQPVTRQHEEKKSCC